MSSDSTGGSVGLTGADGGTSDRTAPPSRTDHVRVALIGDLTGSLRRARGLDEALGSTLALVCAATGAAAGVVHRVDGSGRCQLLASQGSRSALAALAASQPVPDDEPEGMLDVQASGGSAMVRVRAGGGEPVAVLRIVGAEARWTDGDLAELSAAVSDVLEMCWGWLDRRSSSEQARTWSATGRWQWRADLDELWLSEQMYRNLGVDPDSFEHTLEGYLQRVHPDDRDALVEQVAAAGPRGGSWHSTHRVITDAGEVRWMETSGQVARDVDGVTVRLAGVGQDVTPPRGSEPPPTRSAARDALTGLATRQVFLDRLHGALEVQGQPADPGAVAVALVDIVGFRGINEQHGWGCGDRVLQEVATRLLDVDGSVLVARLSADEFGLLFTDPEVPLERLGEAIAGRSDEEVEFAVGIASNLDVGQSADKLLRMAGVALDVAKTRTDARWQVFDPATHQQAVQRLATESALRHAVEADEIDLAYQPVVDLWSGAIVGVEALARWRCPGYGPVSPEVFIPFAERAGLIGRLSAQLLDRACGQLRAWDQAHPRARGLQLAFNLSATQLDDPGLVDAVTDVLARHGLDHDRLVLEVTETALNHDRPGALARLFELRRHGVRVAIDDFGTGYSSLARLRELPFDILKIDRSFVQSIASSHEPTPILEALFAMSRGLGLEVVAEGIETPVQLAVLLRHGCGAMQGYLFSRPLDAAGIGHLLDDPTRWDPLTVAGEVPVPATSPRLQHLLEQVADADDAVALTVIADILDELTELTGLDSVYLTGIDLRDELQVIVAARNVGPIAIAPGTQVRWEDTLCLQALAAATPVIHDVQQTHPELEVARLLGIESYVGIELHGAKGELTGTLCGVAATATDIPQQAVETLRWVARLLPGFPYHRVRTGAAAAAGAS